MAAPKVDAQQVVWAVLVAGFLALAVAAPVEMSQFGADRKAASRAPVGSADSPRVKMVSLSFQPTLLAVRKGTEVVFENDDAAPHTVTDALGRAFDSGTLGSRKVFRLVVQETTEYYCVIHPNMRGKIILTG